MTNKRTNWYKNAVVYQIYPRSFCDGNNDGLGDIPGIISKLDYLEQLGVNCVWLSPIYDSPQKDNGYDIANYRDIYPPFGTLDDFKLMLSGMHERGIKLIMDLVVNHTSDQHPWFQAAIKDKNSPYRDYYIIRKGKKNGKKPPNNWTGFFGERAWSRIGDTEDWYLRLFTKEQPDLNWENPKVREEIIDILRYWLDMGVDGFRCDVITLISKKQDFKDRFPSLVLVGKDAYVNGPRLHEYLHLLYEKAFKDYDCMTVGESVLCSLEDTIKLVKPEREELDMIFNFSHTDVDNFFGVKYLHRKFSLNRLRKRLSKYQFGLANGKGWNSLFIENHDQRRSVGRFGTDDGDLRKVSAKMIGTTYFLLSGTPFIYQGQEIGMTNANFDKVEDYQDVELHNMVAMTKKSWFYRLLIGKHLFSVSRDNARTPMQWNDSKYAGFSKVKPWLKVNDNKKYINVEEAKRDSDSIFHYYQKLIELRKKYPVTIDGEYKLIHQNNKNVYSYVRENKNSKLIVISNFKNKTVKNPAANDVKDFALILSNYESNEEKTLQPYETRVYYMENKL
jgi:oligo-1,6-glucosidase